MIQNDLCPQMSSFLSSVKRHPGLYIGEMFLVMSLVKKTCFTLLVNQRGKLKPSTIWSLRISFETAHTEKRAVATKLVKSENRLQGY